MEKYYTINIPEPCHEDWNAMTPNEKGRHCEACAKTVVDFTQMNIPEIQAYLSQNSHRKICGRVHKGDLSRIKIEIPVSVLSNRMSFHKMFLLALLLTMGMTLFSCNTNNTSPQPISEIELINDEGPSGSPTGDANIGYTQEDGSENDGNQSMIKGDIVVTEMGLLVPPPPEPKPGTAISCYIVERPPEFYDTPKDLNREESMKYFSDGVTAHIRKLFDAQSFDSLGLQGKQRVMVQFTIDTLGQVVDVKARTLHPELTAHAIEVLEQLPTLRPAMHKGQPQTVIYSVPIMFIAEQD